MSYSDPSTLPPRSGHQSLLATINTVVLGLFAILLPAAIGLMYNSVEVFITLLFPAIVAAGAIKFLEREMINYRTTPLGPNVGLEIFKKPSFVDSAIQPAVKASPRPSRRLIEPGHWTYRGYDLERSPNVAKQPWVVTHPSGARIGSSLTLNKAQALVDAEE